MEVENKADAYILKVTIPANMDAEVYLPLPSGKYTVTNNGAPVKVSRVKGEPFLYAGRSVPAVYLCGELTVLFVPYCFVCYLCAFKTIKD